MSPKFPLPDKPINSSGFIPARHVALTAEEIAAEVLSSSPAVADYPPNHRLRLTADGLEWARKLCAERPYFAEYWAITERPHA